MSSFPQRPPTWFWIVAILLVLWGATGVYFFYSELTMSPEAIAALPDIQRKLIETQPIWSLWGYGVAVWGGFLGSLALVLRRKAATLLYILSLLGIVASMGWALLMTELIAVEGLVGAAGFPAFITVIALFQLWLAQRATKRGWLK